VVPRQTSLLLQPPPSDAFVSYEEVPALLPNVILWAHVSLRRPRLIVPASCPAHTILSRRLLPPYPALSCSSRHSPRSMSAPEVDFGQSLIVSLWRFQRSIAGCTLASVAIGLRSLYKCLRAGWHAPGQHRAGETSIVLGRASNACAHVVHQTMSKLDRRYDSQEADGGQCSGSKVSSAPCH
jgi:hypothetical protein